MTGPAVDALATLPDGLPELTALATAAELADALREEPEGEGEEPDPDAARNAAFVAYWSDLVEAVQYATRDPAGLSLYLLTHGRMPRLGDERPPWSFRGWLLPMVMDLAPGIPILGPAPTKRAQRPVIGYAAGRWAYWLGILQRGGFPLPPASPAPPRIDFHGASNGARSGAARKNLEDCCEVLSRQIGFSSTPGALIEWLAWALAVTDHEPKRLGDEAQEGLYRTFNADLWLAAPGDHLGWLLSEFKGRGKDPTGFFPTPHELVALMTQLTMGGDREPTAQELLQKVIDPCVGTGRFLLEASNFSLCLYGQDINPTCTLATLVNGAMYAPWLSFPLPMTPFAQADFSEHPEPTVTVAATEPEPVAPMETNQRGQGLLFG